MTSLGKLIDGGRALMASLAGEPVSGLRTDPPSLVSEISAGWITVTVPWADVEQPGPAWRPPGSARS